MLVHRGVSNICVYYVHVSLDRTLCSLVVRFSRSRDMFVRGSVADSILSCIIYYLSHMVRTALLVALLPLNMVPKAESFCDKMLVMLSNLSSSSDGLLICNNMQQLCTIGHIDTSLNIFDKEFHDDKTTTFDLSLHNYTRADAAVDLTAPGSRFSACDASKHNNLTHPNFSEHSEARPHKPMIGTESFSGQSVPSACRVIHGSDENDCSRSYVRSWAAVDTSCCSCMMCDTAGAWEMPPPTSAPSPPSLHQTGMAGAGSVGLPRCEVNPSHYHTCDHSLDTHSHYQCYNSHYQSYGLISAQINHSDCRNRCGMLYTAARTCMASAGVSLSQSSLAKQVSVQHTAHLDRPACVPGSCVEKRSPLCPVPLGSYKPFGGEDHLALGSPEGVSSRPFSPSPSLSTVLIILLIITMINIIALISYPDRYICKCRCGCHLRSSIGSIYCTMCTRYYCACERPGCCQQIDDNVTFNSQVAVISCNSTRSALTSTGEYKHRTLKSFNTICYQCNRYKYLIIWFIIVLMAPLISAPTTRGAAGSSSSALPSVNDLIPNTQRDYDFLPGMKRWNGIPFIDFLRVWWVALCLALGTISMDGITLLTTAEGNDPYATSTDADEQRKFKQRSTRVFCCIMNYIKTNSRCARIANNEFKHDGPGLFKWLKVWGDLEHDATTKQELLNEWEESSMSKVGIRNNDPEGIWKWLEYLEELSEKIKPGGGKSLSQLRKKFLDGFPEWFDVVITSERLKPDPGSYTIPNQYPSHHPQAGTAHPDRGKPDLQAMALALSPEWSRRCKKIKPAPRGSVYQAESCDDESDSEHADANAVSRNAITASFICLICGGRGHAGSVDGMDCLTKQLGISIPRQELAATKYPNGLKFPSLPNRKRESARYSKESETESARYTQRNDRHSSSREKQKVKFRSKKDGKKPYVKRKSVRQAESEKDTSDDEPEQVDNSESSDSDGEVAAKFAVTYHTINTSGKYNSMSESSDDEGEGSPKPSKTTTPTKSKSATTKANKK